MTSDNTLIRRGVPFLRRQSLVTLAVGLCLFAVMDNRPLRARRTGNAMIKITPEQALRGDLSIPFIPEYDRHLDRVFLGLERRHLPEDLEAKESIIRALPQYTRLVMLVQTDWQGSAELPAGYPALARLRRAALASRAVDRFQEVMLPLRSAGQTPWLQDAGEGGGNSMFLGKGGSGYAVALEKLGVKAMNHVLPLDGGNVSLARNRLGRRFVFIGQKEFANGRTALRAAGKPVSPDEVLTAYQRAFQADQVVVLPDIYPDHIDQTVLFLRDGLAATEELAPLSPADQAAFGKYQAAIAATPSESLPESLPGYDTTYRGETTLLEPLLTGRTWTVKERSPSIILPSGQIPLFKEHRRQVPHLQDLVYREEYERVRATTEALLEEHGFTVVRLATTLRARVNKQFHLNAMVYRNRTTSRTEILFPIYPETGRERAPLDAARPLGRNRANIGILEQLGFAVKPIKGQYLRGGSVHCSIYQL